MSLWTDFRDSIIHPAKLHMDWLLPEPDAPTGRTIESQGTDNAIPVVYGTSTVSSIKVLKVTHDESGGAVNEYLDLICIFCEGEVDEISEIFFDDISENEIPNERYYIERFNGADDQQYCSALGQVVPAWKPTAELNGLCYAYVRLKLNKKLDWWQGEPKIKAKIRGRKVKDVRTGVVAYSDNPANILYDYYTNVRFGKGSPETGLDLDSFKASADFCDQGETYTKTTYVYDYDYEFDHEEFQFTAKTPVTEEVLVKQITCNVVLKTSVKVLDNVKVIRSGCRGLIVPGPTGFKFLIEQGGPSTFAFNKSNMRSSKVSSKGGVKNNFFNRVTVRYPSAQLNGQYDERSWPEKGSEIHLDWLAKDKNIPLERSYDFPTINNAAEALQMAELVCRRSRLGRQITIPGQPWTMEVEPGDITTVEEDTHGYIAKKVRILDKTININGTIDFEAIIHSDGIYPWTVTAADEHYPATNLGLPQDIKTPTGLEFTTAAISADFLGKFIWDSTNNSNVSSYEITLYNDVDNSIVFSEETHVEFINIPYLGQGSYTAELVAKNSLFISDAAILQFSIALPSIPVITVDSITDEAVILSATIGGAPSLANTFHWQFLGSVAAPTTGKIVKGDIYSYVGLIPEIEFKFKCQTVNVAGESAWAEITVKALASSNIVENIRFDQLDENLADFVTNTDRNVLKLNERLTKEEILTLARLADDIDVVIDLQTKTKQFNNVESNISTLNIQSANYTSQLNQITHSGNGILAQANEYAYAGIGRWVNGTWVEGAFSERIRSVQVQTADGGHAKVSEIAQAFQNVDGEYIAKGGMLTDVNGIISGYMTHNNGETSQFDILTQNFRVGAWLNGAFSPSITHYNNKTLFRDGWVNCSVIQVGNGDTFDLGGNPIMNGARFIMGDPLQGDNTDIIQSYLQDEDGGTNRVLQTSRGYLKITPNHSAEAILIKAGGMSSRCFKAEAGTGQMEVADGIAPFTAKHTYLVSLNPDPDRYIGHLYSSGKLFKRIDINNNLLYANMTSKPRDIRAVGALAKFQPFVPSPSNRLAAVNDAVSKDIGENLESWSETITGVNEQEEQILYSTHGAAYVNGVGEGSLLVCAESGDIKAGQWLCSSSIAGHAMLQTDEITGEYEKYPADYAVASADEDVIWANEPAQSKLIAVYYRGG